MYFFFFHLFKDSPWGRWVYKRTLNLSRFPDGPEVACNWGCCKETFQMQMILRLLNTTSARSIAKAWARCLYGVNCGQYMCIVSLLCRLKCYCLIRGIIVLTVDRFTQSRRMPLSFTTCTCSSQGGKIICMSRTSRMWSVNRFSSSFGNTWVSSQISAAINQTVTWNA